MDNETLRTEIAKDITDSGLALVKEKYGTGVSDGETPLSYHNEPHSRITMTEVVTLAMEAIKNGRKNGRKNGEELINEDDAMLLGFAAAYHDTQQGIKERGENERISSINASEKVRSSMVFNQDVVEEKINKLNKMIIGTTTSFATGTMTQPLADDYLSQLLADADVANLGMETDYYWKCTQAYMRELKGKDVAPDQEIPLDIQISFLEDSVKLLTEHKYFTEEAKARYTNQEVNLKYTKQKLEELKALKAT